MIRQQRKPQQRAFAGTIAPIATGIVAAKEVCICIPDVAECIADAQLGTTGEREFSPLYDCDATSGETILATRVLEGR